MTVEMTDALLHGDLERAALIVSTARQAPEGSRPSAELITYWDAAVHAYGEDWQGAAAVLTRFLASVPRSDAASFRLHNLLIALRTVQGDLFGALAETEEMTKAGERGKWPESDSDRMSLVRLKEHWHRAYILRMAAQRYGGAAREALVRYANRARQDYVAVATPLKTLGNSIAALDAYFAFCDGHRSAMLSAARRVNLTEADDLEDLYLIQLALDGGGDTAGADRVRRRMRSLQAANLLAPIVFAWMLSDESAAHGVTPRFSPKYPSAQVTAGNAR
jgi:hypothetical protein